MVLAHSLILQDTLVTKGVASVSSPVRNLREWSDRIDHESFVNAVASEFGRTYADGEELKVQVSRGLHLQSRQG